MAGRSETDVANGALAELGEPPIADLAGDEAAAIAIRAIFAEQRDRVLARHPWNFATAWCTPSADSVASRGPLKKRYPLPDDCLKVRHVEGLGPGEWALEGAQVGETDTPAALKVLVCGIDAPSVCYTRRVPQPALWEPEFAAVLEKEIAAKVAPQIARNSAAKSSELKVDARLALDEAAGSNAREQAGAQITRTTSWITARR
jgi:hypothetical protein